MVAVSLHRWGARLSVAMIGAGLVAPAVGSVALAAPAVTAERTRVLPWTGGDRLHVALNADVRYVPGADNRVVVTGPGEEIDDVVVSHGAIYHYRVEQWWRWWDWEKWWRREWNDDHRIRIVVTAPHLSAAGVSGSGDLDLGRLSQDRLDLGVSGSGRVSASGAIRSLHASVSGSGGVKLTALSTADMAVGLSGSGWVAASGAAHSLHLSISGSGSADMRGLALDDVDAGLSGSGSATVAPKTSAVVWVSGSGSIRLLTEPAHLTTHRSGSGSVIHPNETH